MNHEIKGPLYDAKTSHGSVHHDMQLAMRHATNRLAYVLVSTRTCVITSRGVCSPLRLVVAAGRDGLGDVEQAN